MFVGAVRPFVRCFPQGRQRWPSARHGYRERPNRGSPYRGCYTADPWAADPWAADPWAADWRIIAPPDLDRGTLAGGNGFRREANSAAFRENDNND